MDMSLTCTAVRVLLIIMWRSIATSTIMVTVDSKMTTTSNARGSNRAGKCITCPLK